MPNPAAEDTTPVETPVVTTPPVTPPAAATPPADELDPSLKALFGAALDDAPAPNPDKGERGRSLTEAIAEEPKPDEKKETPKDEKKDTPKDETPPVEKPIRGRKKPAPAPAVAPTPAPVEPAPVAPAAPAKPVDELAGIELLDEEKDNLDLARFAERKNPEKYKGLEGKMTKFIKDHANFIAEERKLDPEAEFDANNPRYQAWLAKNKPTLSASEVRSLERERIIEETTERNRKELNPEIDKMKDELFRRDVEPEIKRSGDGFVRAIIDNAPDAVRKVMKEEGLAKAREKFPFETGVIEDVASATTSDMEELMRLTKLNPDTKRPLRAYDPNNAQHKRIVEGVNALCSTFKEGRKGTVKEGKQFLTRDEFYRLGAAQRAPYWTFSIEDVMARVASNVKLMINTRLTEEEKRLESLGFKRASSFAAPAASPTPSGAPPAPRSAPAAGSGTPPAPVPGLEEKLAGLLMGN